MQQTKVWRSSSQISVLFVITAIALQSRQAAHCTAWVEGAGPGSEQITLSLPQLNLIGGEWEIGKILLSQPAPPGGAKITISAAITGIPGAKPDVTIAPLAPASLAVAAGSTNVQFKLISKAVKAKELVTITAVSGTLSTHVQLSLQPNGVASLSVQPSTLSLNAPATGYITLQHPAPQDVHYYKNMAPSGAPSHYVDQVRTGGAAVALKSSSLAVPASVTVTSGSAGATFAVGPPQVSSCSMGTSSSSSAATITATWETAASTTVHVGQNTGKPSRYTTKTIGIDPKDILGVSHDAHALILNGADKCVQSLVAGDVIFFKKLGVLDVKKVMRIPGGTLSGFHVPSGFAVAVSSAALTDFINEGTFQVFKSTLGDATQPTGPWASGLEPDQPDSGDDYWKYKTSGTGTTYSFLAYKQKDGLQASVSGNGQITKFGYNFLAVIHNARLQQATYKVDTDGTLDVDWMVQTTAPGQNIGESRLRLPPMHAGIVDSADDIPLLLQVYGNLIFKPGFGEKAAAKGHFRVTYSGEGGIDGSTPLGEGLKAQTEISSTTSSAKAAHGAVVAVNAPKFALSLSTVSFLYALGVRMPTALNAQGAQLADSLQGQLGTYVKGDLMPPTAKDLFKIRRAAYVGWVTSIGYAGAGMLAMFPCQQYYQTFVALAGVDKDMLGSISGSIPPKDGVTAFQDKKTTIIPLIKGCEPKPASMN